MKHIYLIRHGKSESNEDRYIHLLKKDADIALSTNGKQQSLIAGDFFAQFLAENNLLDDKFKIFTSPFLRAQQTRDLMLSRINNLQITSSTLDNLLIEQDLGWEGIKTKEDVDEIEHNANISTPQEIKFYKEVKQGEARCAVVERVRPFVTKEILNTDGSHIIIFSHGTLIRAISYILTRVKPAEFEHIPPNTAIKELIIDDDNCLDKGWIYTP
jgi:broad specificity phosphatase PhoE